MNDTVLAKAQTAPCHFIEGAWADFRDDVRATDRELADIIDEISPDSKYKLIKGAYRYGEQITHLGTIYVPNQHGQSTPLYDQSVTAKLKEQLGYATTPLALQLNKTSEVYVETPSRVIPLNIIHRGDMFGLFESLKSYTQCPIVPCWSVASGARSVFLAPKVSDAIGNKNLKKAYNVSPDDTHELSRQWNVFKKIAAKQPGSNQPPWASEILLFTGDWMKDRNDSIAWLKFQKCLLKRAWGQSRGVRVKSEYSMLWEIFASTVSQRNYKPDAYVVNTIMHTLFIANRAIAGFRPISDDSETLLPSKMIETAYQEVYTMLRDYSPVILAPAVLGGNDNYSPVYYSYFYPTLLEGAFLSGDVNKGTMQVLRQVKPLMEMLKDILDQQKGELYNFMRNAHFSYYHPKEDRLGEALSCDRLVDNDSNILACIKRFPKKQFPFQGPFFKGCCQILHQK